MGRSCLVNTQIKRERTVRKRGSEDVAPSVSSVLVTQAREPCDTSAGEVKAGESQEITDSLANLQTPGSVRHCLKQKVESERKTPDVGLWLPGHNIAKKVCTIFYVNIFSFLRSVPRSKTPGS